MSFDEKKLYELLPAVYRIRDAEQGQPLLALFSVLAEQITAVEENLEQLYDDQFIETCADWVVPYIGDLIGYRLLDGNTAEIASPRAEVAHTIAFRRRKGTATMLEQLARDVTGWDARAVEFFQLLATTQYMNHTRPNNVYAPDLRDWKLAQWLGTAFEETPHTVEVRRIAPRRGRYNIKNVGLFLYRLDDFSWSETVPFEVGPRRYMFSPLGCDTQLFTNPEAEDEIHHLADPINVPHPLSRRLLHERLNDYYGRDEKGQIKSFEISVGGAVVPESNLVVCDLSDVGGGNWAHQPEDKVGVDPVLGRIAFPSAEAAPGEVEVTFHYGFSAAMGGGEYERTSTLQTDMSPVVSVTTPSSIQTALNNVSTGGAVEVKDNETYSESLTINVDAGRQLELRADNERRPLVVLGGNLEISGGQDSEVTLNGLVIAGGALKVSSGGGNELRRLRLRHCTLVPGLSLGLDRTPVSPGQPGLIVEIDNLTLEIEDCILGSIRIAEGSKSIIKDSVIDADQVAQVAYAAPDGVSVGGELTFENCTVIGKINTRLMRLVSNSILLAETAPGDVWDAPVRSERRQEGCVRYSYLPLESVVPRRHNCHPENQAEADRVRPQFTSLEYGHPGYGQLARYCADEIRRGADDEAEMGAFHKLFQPQRESNLRMRLREYLRFGLEAGIFYAT